jgi:uncharacterized protein (TIGR00251 family)
MYIKVRVTPNSKEESFTQKAADHFEVKVKEKAEQNQANRRVTELVRQYFKTNNVRIISGHHSPSKIFSVED